MNWKYQTGKLLASTELSFIKLNSGFIRRNFPYGRNWLFDIKRILKTPPSVIIDAGANVGSVSLELNYWFPEAAIYAFEPIQNTFNLLVKQSTGKNNIHPFCLGLGSQNEEVEILLSSEDTINSLKIKDVRDGIIGKENITITRLDDFLQERSIPHIDILKIDVEGFEFDVLNGCGSLINDNIKCIYLEVGYERDPTKVHFSDVEQYMEEKDFMLCGIYETRRSLHDKRKLWYSNNLYIKRSLLT